MIHTASKVYLSNDSASHVKAVEVAVCVDLSKYLPVTFTLFANSEIQSQHESFEEGAHKYAQELERKVINQLHPEVTGDRLTQIVSNLIACAKTHEDKAA